MKNEHGFEPCIKKNVIISVVLKHGRLIPNIMMALRFYGN